METNEVVIKGQAWLMPKDNTYSLVQDEVVIVAGSESYNKTTVLVEDIWADLKKADNHLYKVGGPKNEYFYWAYEMNEIVDEVETTVEVHFECPKPAPGVFTEPYDPESAVGDYPKYWIKRLKTATDNAEYMSTIQKKEIVITGTSYIDPVTGMSKKVEDIIVNNTDTNDISNLLNSLF